METLNPSSFIKNENHNVTQSPPLPKKTKSKLTLNASNITNIFLCCIHYVTLEICFHAYI